MLVWMQQTCVIKRRSFMLAAARRYTFEAYNWPACQLLVLCTALCVYLRYV